jgi:hypothetical protein
MMAESLAGQLAELESRRVKEIVVATHVVSFRELVYDRNELPADFLTAYQGSVELESLRGKVLSIYRLSVADRKTGHKMATVPCESLCRRVNMGFDPPPQFDIISCKTIVYTDKRAGSFASTPTGWLYH